MGGDAAVTRVRVTSQGTILQVVTRCSHVHGRLRRSHPTCRSEKEEAKEGIKADRAPCWVVLPEAPAPTLQKGLLEQSSRETARQPRMTPASTKTTRPIDEFTRRRLLLDFNRKAFRAPSFPKPVNFRDI